MSLVPADLYQSQNGVFHAREWGKTIDPTEIAWLIREAGDSERGIARICLHPSVDDSVQHMLVALTNRTPYPRHKHPFKNESIIPVLGSGLYREYSPEGLTILERFVSNQEGARYLTTLAGNWHSLESVEDVFVYWELTTGPWTPSATVHA